MCSSIQQWLRYQGGLQAGDDDTTVCNIEAAFGVNVASESKRDSFARRQALHRL
jgi:hypothetical protein